MYEYTYLYTFHEILQKIFSQLFVIFLKYLYNVSDINGMFMYFT